MNQEAQQIPDSRPSLILVDDDPLITESLAFVLKDEFLVHVAESRKAIKSNLQNMQTAPSLALVDLGLPPNPHVPQEGFLLVQELLAFNPSMKILILSGQSNKPNIQHALTLGAVDFIPKPADVSLLKARLQHQLMILEAEQVEHPDDSPMVNMLGEHGVMKTLRAQVTQFAFSPFPVLVEGESGCGKELVVQCLYSQGPRAHLPLVTVNCSAISSDLLESLLFGHVKGAFTGATEARPGFFEEAGNGTLFLDEIGEFPLELQPKLLRVLENGDYYRLGETRPRNSDARIIAATNRDLREEVRAGRFREDLYHRLGVLSIRVPSLRERGDDCLLLLNHFRTLYTAHVPPFSLGGDSERRLREYSYPGNVRELRNIVIRLAAKYPGRNVELTELEQELESHVFGYSDDDELKRDERAEQQLTTAGFQLDKVLSEWEERYIKAALKLSDGNLSRAARMLGVNRTTLYSRIQRQREGI